MEIDVSKCKYYDSKDCLCEYDTFNWEIEKFYKCKDNTDCYYKQLQQLKAENEELKEVIYDALEDFRGEYGTNDYDRLLVRASKHKIDISDFGEILYGKE